ncbi:MAG TPA: hypothetical protein VI277_04900 [Candidatus Limnocylindria bacterium]
MSNFDRQPGAIDDPGLKGGLEPDLDRVPSGSTTDTGTGAEPDVTVLDLPGPGDPVAWNYVEANTLVVGPHGEELGRVGAMLGLEDEGIFHGVAVIAYDDGAARIVPADAVTRMTPARVEIAWDAGRLSAAERPGTDRG